MECRLYSENLTAFIDGELSREAELGLEGHLQSCADCQAEYESLTFSARLVNSYSSGDALQAPAWGLIHDRISAPTANWSDFRWLFNGRWAGALAVLLLAVFSLPFYWTATQPEALLQQQLAVFVSQRDQTERIHRGIINIEPVGWITHNPFRESDSNSANPFSLE